MNNPAHSQLPKTLVGSDLLGFLTLGMYSNPLTLYREYVQNAADSIASTGALSGRIEIHIDPSKMCVTIKDDGPGLSHKQALRQLVPIADSRKVRSVARGFRGIGRLSGLAFAESVSFLTRKSKEDPVTRVRWDGSKLRELLSEKVTIEKTIQESIVIDVVLDTSYPEHFFQVEIVGISRFAAGSLLNGQTVRDYIAETCPVPFASEFEFREHVSEFLDEATPLELSIFMNDEDTPVLRHHNSHISISETFNDSFTEIEQITVPSLDGNNNAAAGWIAHSSYLGTLPKSLGIRGLRARDGNIQVGNESVFDHLFTESRLNRWCVGEINILDTRIVPDGKRDYFEPGPHTRNLENHLTTIIRTLERRIRNASSLRNTVRRIRKMMDDADAVSNMVKSGYLTKSATEHSIEKTLQEISKLKKNARLSPHFNFDHADLDDAESKLHEIQKADWLPDSISGIKKSEVAIYQSIFSRLAGVCGCPQTAKITIEEILAQSADMK